MFNKLNENCCASFRSTLWPARQNSVLCLLLSVPQIQRDLLKFILDTLYERVLTNEQNASSLLYGVIQALKWQDAINDPEVISMFSNQHISIIVT